VPILKVNLNAEDLNFSIHLLNLNILLSGQPNITSVTATAVVLLLIRNSVNVEQ